MKLKSILIILALFLSSCMGTYYISDAEYSDAREFNTSKIFHQGELYWGWNDGFYYYYGKPHYYPWNYYYNTCPPSHYNTSTHIVISSSVNKPTHRPSLNRPTYSSNNRSVKVRPNINRTRVNIKSNTNKVKKIVRKRK